jgi:hypothetical protein
MQFFSNGEYMTTLKKTHFIVLLITLFSITSFAMAPKGSDVTLQEEGHSANNDGPENPYNAEWTQIEQAFEAGDRQAVVMVVKLFEKAGLELRNYYYDEQIMNLHNQTGMFLFTSANEHKIMGADFFSEDQFYDALIKVFPE